LLSRLLRPAFRAWYTRVIPTFEAIPTPVDEPTATASGRGEDRILIVGSGPAAGWGVRSHDLALPGQLARELAARTGHGTRVDVVATRSMTIADAVPALEGRPLATYRTIVVVLGISDAMTLLPEGRWRSRMQGLAAFLHDSAPDAQIVLAGVPPIASIPVYGHLLGRIANRHAVRLNAITRATCLRRAHLTFAPLGRPTPQGESRHRGPEEYRQWARELAAAMVPKLRGAAAEAPRGRGEEDRADRALEQRESLAGAPAPGVDRVLSLARSLFSADLAAVALVSRDRVWFPHRSGEWAVESLPRQLSVCTHTVRAKEAFVIGDLSTHELFAGNETLARAGVRFYAGYPLETPDGHPMGALCVLGRNPRPADSINRALLRDVALLAQRELWKISREAAESALPLSGPRGS
jgi:hypothetical protein